MKKYSGQSIVYNIPGTGDVTVGQSSVHIYNADGTLKRILDGTTSALDGNKELNQAVDDEIFEHITYNIYESQGNVDIHNTSGLFLAPYAQKFTQENGAGWRYG